MSLYFNAKPLGAITKSEDSTRVEPDKGWTFGNAVIFAFTVITTIGKQLVNLCVNVAHGLAPVLLWAAVHTAVTTQNACGKHAACTYVLSLYAV